MHCTRIRAYLDCAAGIAALLPQAERLIELRRLYQRMVPQELLRSSSIVNFKQGSVVIFTENNAVAAKLKLLSPRLVNNFSRGGHEVTGIRVEVQPGEHPRDKRAAKLAKLSPSAAGCLRALAERLPNSDLKQSVVHLVEHGAAPVTSPDAHDCGQDQRGLGKS